MTTAPAGTPAPQPPDSLLHGVKRAFTAFDLEPDSGVVAQPGVDAGYLRRIRLWNFLEPVLLFFVVQVVVWCELYTPDFITWRLCVGLPAMLWMFVLSPIVHCHFERDVFLAPGQRKRGYGWYFWELRGMGNPIRYYLPRDGQPALIVKHWRVVAGVLAAMTLLYVSAALTFSKEIDVRYAHIYGQSPLLRFLFLAGLVAAIDLTLLLVAFPVMLRLDNFARSIRFIIAFFIGVTVFVLLFNLCFQFLIEPFRETLSHYRFLELRGPSARERLAVLADPLAIGGQWSGYVVWGWIQQFIFVSYFGVLFARAFDITRSRGKLFLACFCSALLFSLIHIPNVWLMFFTFIGGLVGIIYFLQCRNLFALGFVHGFGGSLLNKLTPINFSVGPGQIK
jgi:hypothetical protein